MTADAYDGRQIVALVYVSKPNRLIANGLPPLRYLKLLQEGAAQWGLDPAHISYVAVGGKSPSTRPSYPVETPFIRHLSD